MASSWLEAGRGFVGASLLALLAACGGGGGGGGGSPPNPPNPPPPMFPPVLDPTGQQLGAFYAVTSSNRFVSFNPGASAFSTGVVILGIPSNDRIVGVEARLADRSVLLLGTSGTVYSLNTTSGAATPFVRPFTQTPNPLPGTRFGFEVTASPEQVRIVSDTGVNLALAPIDDSFSQLPMGANLQMLEPLPTGISEIAGTQNLVPCGDPSVLYLLNTDADQLQVEQMQQGKRVAVPVGSLGVDAEAASGFEIVQNSNRVDTAVAVLRVGGTTSLYGIDLVTGQATLQSALQGLASGESIVGLTAPPVDTATPRRGDIVAVTASGKLMSFDDDLPQAVCLPPTPVTGMNAGEQIVDIDTRPTNGVVYALTNAAQVYTISTALETFGQASGAVSLQADPSSPINGTSVQIDRSFNIDFNPSSGRLTAINRDLLRYAIDVDSGNVTLETQPGISSVDVFPSQAPVTAIAYTGSFAPAPDGFRQTFLFGSPLVDDVLSRVDINGATGLRYLANPARDGRSSILQTTRVLPLSSSRGQRIGGGEPVRGLTYVPLARASVFAVSIENRLLQFSPATPEQIDANLPITGLLDGEQVQSIDFRPLDGQLYALTNLARLYTLEAVSGAATVRATLSAAPGDDNPFTGLDGTPFDIDFSPITRQLRVVSAAGQNLRVDVTTGATITDAPLNNSLTRPSPPRFAGTAYLNFTPVGPSAVTQLLSLDVANDRVVQVIRGDGTTLAVRDLGQLRSSSGRLDVQEVLGFDFDPTLASSAYAVLRTSTEAATVVTFTGAASGTPFITINGTLPLPAPFDRVLGLTGLRSMIGPGGPLVALLGAPSGQQALTSFGRNFDQAAPATASAPVVITGVMPGDSLVSIDFRTQDALLYGLGSSGTIYRINATSGAATTFVTLAAGLLTGTRFEMDFNGLDNSLAILNDQGSVLLVSFSGDSISSTQLRSIDYAALAPAAIAYTRNQSDPGRSTQLILDRATVSLFGAGSLPAFSVSVSMGLDEITDGTQSLLGPLDQVSRFRELTPLAALDVAGGVDSLILAALQLSGMTQSMLYSVNVNSPSATLGLPPGKPIGPPGTPAVRALTIRIQ